MAPRGFVVCPHGSGSRDWPQNRLSRGADALSRAGQAPGYRSTPTRVGTVPPLGSRLLHFDEPHPGRRLPRACGPLPGRSTWRQDLRQHGALIPHAPRSTWASTALNSDLICALLPQYQRSSSADIAHVLRMYSVVYAALRALCAPLLHLHCVYIALYLRLFACYRAVFVRLSSARIAGILRHYGCSMSGDAR